MTIARDELAYRQSTSAVILNKSGQILIVQKNSYKDNEWDIPGGGIENGEAAEAAIIRELSEELGSNKFEKVRVSELVDRYEWPEETILKRMAEGKGLYRGQERVQFLVNFFGEEAEIKPEVEEIRMAKWVFPNELPTYFIFPRQMQKMEILLKEFEVDI